MFFLKDTCNGGKYRQVWPVWAKYSRQQLLIAEEMCSSVIDGVHASMSVIPLSFLPQEILAILEYVYILLKYGVCVLVCITF